MFDAIVFKNAPGPGPLIDVGALAEALLFYGRVTVVGNSATLKDILSKIPPFILLSLLKDERLEFRYLEDQAGVTSTQLANGSQVHKLIRFSSPQHTLEKIGPQSFIEAAGATGQAKLAARQFTRLLKALDHAGFNQEATLQALCNQSATDASVAAMIRLVTPDYAMRSPLHFRLERQDQGFIVDTNIEFRELNASYHRYVSPSHSSMSEAYIVALLQEAYESTYYAAMLNAEVAVTPIERVVQAKTIESLVQRHANSSLQIERFEELTLDGARAIREAVNSGEVPFASVVKLLDSADKFRHWLREQPEGKQLIQAFYQETVKESWVQRLPAKTTRWSLFTGIGLGIDSLGAGGLGTLAGVGLSAIDAFLLDKLTNGWKPHQFIEGELKPVFNATKK